MDISKVVDCNPHNLFMAYSYGFYITFVYSCLKRRKQNVKIDNVLSPFQPLISGVQKRFNFTSNIFLNDVVTRLEMSDVSKFANNNTITIISVKHAINNFRK